MKPVTWLVSLIIISILCGCIYSSYPQKNMAEDAENFATAFTPAYFGGWKSYQVPFVPDEPISREEAEKRKSYYVGYYSNDGKLVKFEKYLDGRLNWQDEYTYWDNGKLRTRVMVKADGSRTVQNFDRRGHLLK